MRRPADDEMARLIDEAGGGGAEYRALVAAHYSAATSAAERARYRNNLITLLKLQSRGLLAQADVLHSQAPQDERDAWPAPAPSFEDSSAQQPASYTLCLTRGVLFALAVVLIWSGAILLWQLLWR